MLRSDPETWTDPRHRLGVAAEETAARLLEIEGFVILDHRFRFQRHDVDLVARRGSTVVFAEVKARTRRHHGSGSEAVTHRKQRDLVRTASVWLQRHGRPGDVARFDVISLEQGRVDWLQNAFRPGWR